jgi:hypothetical protein
MTGNTGYRLEEYSTSPKPLIWLMITMGRVNTAVGTVSLIDLNLRGERDYVWKILSAQEYFNQSAITHTNCICLAPPAPPLYTA